MELETYYEALRPFEWVDIARSESPISGALCITIEMLGLTTDGVDQGSQRCCKDRGKGRDPEMT